MSACIDWGAIFVGLFWLVFGSLALLGLAVVLSILLSEEA